MVKKRLLITKIKRAKGKLYYCGTDSKGYITVNETSMARRGKRKKK